MAALTAAPAVAVPPVSAWLSPPVIRRKETERRLLVVNHAVIERYTPPSISWSAPPKVIKVDFVRKLIEQAPQVTYPPTTGPPVEYFPAWAATFVTYRPDSARKALFANPNPSTPLVASNSRATDEPFSTKTQRSRRVLSAPPAPVYPASPIEFYPAWLGPEPLTRQDRPRKRLEIEAVYAPAFVSELYPAWAGGVARYRPDAPRRAATEALSFFAPTTPPTASNARATEDPFATRVQRSRRLLSALTAPVYPSAGGPVPAEFAALVLPKAYRLRPQQRVVLGGTVAYRSLDLTSPYPSWQPSGHHKRRELERRPLADTPNPSYPATPPSVTPAEYPSFVLETAIRRKGWRKHQADGHNPEHPQTPLSTSRALEEPFTTRTSKSRKALSAILVPEFPGAAPPPPAGHPSWVLETVIRREGWVKLRTAEHNPDYPATPPQVVPHIAAFPQAMRRRKPRERTLWGGVGAFESSDLTSPYPSWVPAGHHKRRELNRKRLALAHNPSYPATPPTQAVYPSFIAEKVIKRQGWRKHASTGHNPQHPATPPPPQQPEASFKATIAKLRIATERRLLSPLVATLWVQPAAPVGDPPTFTGPIPDIAWLFNTGSHSHDLSVYFSGATSYSISPGLEVGWSFNTSTAELIVDTDEAGQFGQFTITATNSGGSVQSNGFWVAVVKPKLYRRYRGPDGRVPNAERRRRR